jgi:tRNA(Ile)-lysidine synthase
LGLECLVLRGDLPGGNLEQEARRVRYRWFRELIAEGVIERVALGHTLSDQAETVLFRFLRGSGTAGLAGIRAETGGLFRPLLGKTREEVRRSLVERGIAWREDSSNSCLDFARNRIRAELLPELERDWNPELTRVLGHTAEWAAAEEVYWAGAVRKLARKYFLGGGVVQLPRGAAVQRRLIRHAIETVKGDLRQIEYRHVEAVRAMLSGRLDLPGLRVEKSFEWWRFTLPGAEERAVLDGVGLELLEPGAVYNSNKDQIDWNLLSGPLQVRVWQPGDRYQRVGRPAEERLKLLFQKARVPVWERRVWPVLVSGERIVWSRGFGVAAGWERSEKTHRVLQVRDISGFPNLNP